MGAWSILLLTSILSGGGIWTCERDGVREFADRPCRGADSESVLLGQLNVVSAPPLGAGEQAQLDALAKRAADAPDTRRAHPEVERNATACEDAQARLEAVRDQRRRGYKLKDEPKLIAAAEALTRDIRRYC